MKKKASLSIGGVLLAIVAAFFLPSDKDKNDNQTNPNTPNAGQSVTPEGGAGKKDNTPTKKVAPKTVAPKKSEPKKVEPKPAVQPKPVVKPKPVAKPAAKPKLYGGLPASTSRVGFTSYRSLESHYKKHGHEFGRISQDDYLEGAKALRDAALSRSVQELKRKDGVITRFDQRSGGFVAFHKDKTIRTYFKPNDGAAYFRRQARR